MPYNELRKDYLLDRWVVIATERARRPNDFAKQRAQRANVVVCPLCPGNEHMTPPATLVYLPTEKGIRKDRDEGDFRQKNWIVRVIPNLYPAFTPPKTQVDADQIMQNSSQGNAIGHHEVIIESNCHSDHPSEAPLPQLVYVINAYKDRLRDLASKPYVQYVQIFRNQGIEAGASLSHAHSQLIATPFIPGTVLEEQQASQAYFKEHESCVFCDIVRNEANSPRSILENEHFLVFSPYASVNAMEFWILPKRHAPNILSLTEDETLVFAQTMQSTLKALKILINDPPYNFGIHLALDKDVHSNHYHWHLEVYPHLALWAGFEKSAGMYINTVRPETAAQELKKVLNT